MHRLLESHGRAPQLSQTVSPRRNAARSRLARSVCHAPHPSVEAFLELVLVPIRMEHEGYRSARVFGAEQYNVYRAVLLPEIDRHEAKREYDPTSLLK